MELKLESEVKPKIYLKWKSQAEQLQFLVLKPRIEPKIGIVFRTKIGIETRAKTGTGTRFGTEIKFGTKTWQFRLSLNCCEYSRIFDNWKSISKRGWGKIEHNNLKLL